MHPNEPYGFGYASPEEVVPVFKPGDKVKYKREDDTTVYVVTNIVYYRRPFIRDYIALYGAVRITNRDEKLTNETLLFEHQIKLVE